MLMNSAPKNITHDNSSKSRDANRRVRWWGYCLYKKHRKQKDREKRKKNRKSKDRKKHEKQKNRNKQGNWKKHGKQRDWKKHGKQKNRKKLRDRKKHRKQKDRKKHGQTKEQVETQANKGIKTERNGRTKKPEKQLTQNKKGGKSYKKKWGGGMLWRTLTPCYHDLYIRWQGWGFGTTSGHTGVSIWSVDGRERGEGVRAARLNCGDKVGRIQPKL